jgi:YD repeat-containing protein
MKYREINKARWKAMEREATTQDACGYDGIKDENLLAVVKKRCHVNKRTALRLIDQHWRDTAVNYDEWRRLSAAERSASINGYR